MRTIHSASFCACALATAVTTKPDRRKRRLARLASLVGGLVQFLLILLRMTGAVRSGKWALASRRWCIHDSDAGWFVARCGVVSVVRTLADLSERSFQHYLSFLEQELREPPFARGALLYDVQGAATGPATRRKAVADILARYKEQQDASTIAYAYASPERMVRGALQAIYWISPPGYPYAIVEDAAAGFAFLGTYGVIDDLPGVIESYEGLVRDYEDSLSRASRPLIRVSR